MDQTPEGKAHHEGYEGALRTQGGHECTLTQLSGIPKGAVRLIPERRDFPGAR